MTDRKEDGESNSSSMEKELKQLKVSSVPESVDHLLVCLDRKQDGGGGE